MECSTGLALSRIPMLVAPSAELKSWTAQSTIHGRATGRLTAFQSALEGGRNSFRLSGKRNISIGMLKCALVDEQATEEDDEQDRGLSGVETESLQILEWNSVCKQVARFTSTPMARDICEGGSIPIGKSQKESEELLEQTAAACLLPSPLDFSGIVNVDKILTSACSGSVMSVSELCLVEKTLSSIRCLYEQLLHCIQTTQPSQDDIILPFPSSTRTTRPQEESFREHSAFTPLMSIMADLNFCTSYAALLENSLDSGSASILDNASSDLSTIRANRRKNMKTLESLLLEVGEKIVSAGGMDSVIVTTRRARQCVAVRASHKHLVPGGVVLALSNSGATVFMEPKAALELNNKEVELAYRERAEEFFILQRLTEKLVKISTDVWLLLERVTSLDLACAKAGHAQWLHSAKPTFDSKKILPREGGEHCFEDSNCFSVYIEGLSHPLLLGQALMDSENSADVTFPVPVDFKVKSGVSVIVISGPNTGGKTASMKTLGVSALMAKAGLFLPCIGKAFLLWFDKVLADIGDSQSLEQSLSTFSGHIQRVCRIMEAGGSRSLVLFDEIGSGTDPSEGAALATAILQHMAENVFLTVATTHFSKLSTLADRQFEVASLEFDTQTLSPKYKVLWGVIGQSNALNIATSLGVHESVLACARHWMRKLAPENQEQRASQLMDPLLEQRQFLHSQAAVVASVLLDAIKLHDELAAEVNGLETRIGALRLQREEKIRGDMDSAKAQMEKIVFNFGNSSRMSMGEALSAIASVVAAYRTTYREPEKASIQLEEASRPSVGDFVLIKRLGQKFATVIEASTENNESLLVQLGSLKLRAKLSEVAKIVKNKKVC